MGHLAGIRHYKGNRKTIRKSATPRHFENQIQAGLDFLRTMLCLSEPGRQFHYSTQGYTLVGCVIEGASARKYVDFVRQNVFVPAGMKQTQVDNHFTIIPYRTPLLSEDESGTVENADFLDSSYKIPGGGWVVVS